MPADAVAMVGTQPIPRAQWLRAVQAVEADRGAALDAAGRRQVLQRLIDEELLFQHALDSGLARNDPGLRKTLVAGLIDAATAGQRVDEIAARALFERDPAYFAAQPRLRVTAARIVGDGVPIDTQRVLDALRDGLSESALRPVALPPVPLPLAQLAQRLGGSVADALHRAEPGSVIGPLPAGGGGPIYALLHERIADAPRYEDVADAVHSEWTRRKAETALEQLLASLRRTTTVTVANDR